MKKMFRITGLLLCFILLLSVCPAMAADVEHIKNGGFEEVTDGVLTSWKIAPDADTVYPTDAEKHDGEYALRLGGSSYATQDIRTILGGGKYTFTAWMRPKIANAMPAIKVEFYAASEYIDAVSYDISGFKAGKWQEITYTFTIPEGATRINLLLRAYGSHEVLWDEASLMGPASEQTASQGGTDAVDVTLLSGASHTIELLPMAPDGRELITNPSFEHVEENGVPTDWKDIFKQTDSDGNPYASITDEIAHEGDNSFKVKTASSNLPWVSYFVTEGIEEGAVYQCSMWINLPEKLGRGCGFKFEFYSNDVMSGATSIAIERGISNSTFLKTPTDGWQQYADTVTIPKGAKSMALYVRSYSAGTVYFDDVSCYKVADPVKGFLETDDVFYYTDEEYGKATLSVNDYFYPELLGGSASFRLLKGDAVVAEKGMTALRDGTASFAYTMEAMTEKEAEYTVEGTLYNSTGGVAAVYTQGIYKYDRPTNLGKDGVITKKGVRIENPNYTYGAWDLENTYPKLDDIGVTVVQGTPNEETLTAAKENGLYVLGVLYGDMIPAGDPSKAQYIENAVTKYKDYDALIGWMVMDEYHYNYPTSYDLLRDSYIAIRKYDDANPVFVMEADGANADSAKYVDLFGYDPYPQGKHPVATYISDFTEIVTEQAKYAAPVWCLNQTFDYGNYYPTPADARSMMYQTLFAGGDAIGHYKFEGTRSGTNLDATELWDGFVSFAEKELDDAFGHFAYREFPLFKEAKEENVWYSLFVKENKVHAVVLNRKEEVQTVSIALASDCGTATVGAFTAECIGGAGEAVSGNGTLTVTLQPNDVLTYIITPSEAVDFSELPISAFRDLGEHAWAATQIRALEAKGIVTGVSENFYAPQVSITRGDFAMFLIRALGLTADATENFADVSPNARFAKEIAIGKKLGILKGTDSVHYNPYEEISRQDLMVICARGMRAKKALEEGDASSFSDAEAIADYAVADIAAMVRANIVTGYEDGTIRPLGNTTRAEAAVIMDRIVTWNENP